VRERIAEDEAAGSGRDGPAWTAREWRAALAAARADRPAEVPGGAELAALQEKVAQALLASTAATVWQRLHDGGEVHCSLRTFQRYVAERIRTTDPARLTVPMPDPAFGEAMEIDFGRLGTWTDAIGGKRRAVWAFVATLRASGMHFVRPVLRMDRAAWITCHSEALLFFGGSPRFWICDNLKGGVLKADLYDPTLNRAYRELAEHHGAIIDPARAVHPKDKPRVERAVPYVRDSFWSGRSFTSFDEIVQDAVVWSRDTAPRRRHRVHRITVRELFEQHERPALLLLPERPFALVEWKDVKVHPDLSVEGKICQGSWSLRCSLPSEPKRGQGGAPHAHARTNDLEADEEWDGRFRRDQWRPGQVIAAHLGADQGVEADRGAARTYLGARIDSGHMMVDRG
jgi:transposase